MTWGGFEFDDTGEGELGEGDVGVGEEGGEDGEEEGVAVELGHAVDGGEGFEEGG